MNKTFAVGIPTLNRRDLLEEALKSYEQDFPTTRIFIVDNGDQGINDTKNVTVFRPGRNMGVAASWNLLCNNIFTTYDYSVILNDDIVWGVKENEMISHIISLFTWFNYGFVKSEKEWSFFAMSKNTFTLVGQFDEKYFPAYFEDNDYSYRMQLAGINTYSSESFNPIVYRNSMTWNLDRTLNLNFMGNREYYIRKWGGLPGAEIFNIPFNGAIAI